jgi:dihydrofolate reductase
MQWEYKALRWFDIHDAVDQGFRQTSAKLTVMGGECWELIGTVDDRGEAPDYGANPVLIFKRPRAA